MIPPSFRPVSLGAVVLAALIILGPLPCLAANPVAETPVAAGVPAGTVLHVSPAGNDAWSGQLAAPNDARTDGPFASPSRAQAAVRALKAQGLAQPLTVVLHAGVYELPETLVFTPEDSGTEACPITYMAQPGEAVVLRGGRTITGWEPWRDGIYRADLKTQGLDGARFHQLFYRGRRQTLARYPDLDPAHPRTGGQLYVEDTAPRPRAQLFYAEGAVPFDRWRDFSQAEVVSTYCQGWNFALTPIETVDTARRLITTRQVRREFLPLNRFFIQNVPDALDSPGEWFLDYQTSLLHFHPPDGAAPGDDVVVPVLDHIVELRGTIPYPHGYLRVSYQGTREDFPMPAGAPPDDPVQYLTFRGFTFEAARHSALRLVGARHCAVIGNRITNIGNYGVNLGGVTNAYPEVGNPRLSEPEGEMGGVGGAGQDLLFCDPCQDCRVAGNDIWSLGADGIFLYGTGNVAENNHVYDIGLFDKDCACINLFGERNVARRNHLHDVPRNAVFLKGVDNVVELNDLHHTMLETCDGGAIRMCQRNLNLRGSILRFNRIVDTVGYGYPRNTNTFLSPYYNWGIYLDDFTCGTTIQGNLIVRTARGGVMYHGGSDNIVEDNVLVDAGTYALEHAPIRDRPIAGNVARRNLIVCNGDQAFPYRATRWVEGAWTFDRNLVWTRNQPARVDQGPGGRTFDTWEAWQAAGLDPNSVVADPLFVAPDAGDYRLRDDSPAWALGFRKLPSDEIGCYESPERASWPPVTEPHLVREEPVLYSMPARPLSDDYEVDVVGRPPRHGDVLAYPKAPIAVTDERAADGKHSLKFTDAPDLPNDWAPRIYWPFDYRDGTVRFACDLWLDGARPPRLYVDPRQYSDTGGREYLSGPMLRIEQDGSLMAGATKLADLPFDTWFRLEITMVLGPGAPSSSRAVLTVRGQDPLQLEIPHVSPAFQRLERIVISSLTTQESVFHLDNVTCGPTG